MNGIDKIKQRIAQDLQQQSDAIRQKAEEEARDILARYAQIGRASCRERV